MAAIKIDRDVLEDLVDATRQAFPLSLSQRRALRTAENLLEIEKLKASVHPGQLQLFNPDDYR